MSWTFKRPRWAILYVLLAAALIGWAIAFSMRSVMDRAAAMTERTRFNQPPVFIGLQALPESEKLEPGKFEPGKLEPGKQESGKLEPGKLKPFALALRKKNLLVSYLSSDRVDEFSERFDHLRTLHLLNKEPASITGLAVEDDRIYAADFKSGDLLFTDYKTGKLLQVYGWQPDHSARMKALGVTFYRNNLYVSDAASRQMLTIGASTEKGAREEGELISRFPNGRAAEFELDYPTWSMVTPDGRLLVSDSKSGEIKAFTCSGRSAHLFEKEGEAALKTPMGIAMDSLPSPALVAKKA
ncbi:MAG: hypothetical protein OEV15_09300, partial [Gallionella sp.]|nr:hypothetical protein [Gallionella sp.]